LENEQTGGPARKLLVIRRLDQTELHEGAKRQTGFSQKPNKDRDLRIEEKSTMGKTRGTLRISEVTTELELEIGFRVAAANL
jgi:hypothetical protein